MFGPEPDALIDSGVLPAATAALADLDPQSSIAVTELLARLTTGQRVIAHAVRDAVVRDVGATLQPAAPRTPAPKSSQAHREPDLEQVPDGCWVAGYLAAVPAVSGWMRARQVPDDIIAATLGDIGRQLRLHRRNTGGVGFDAPRWPVAVLSGSLYQLGRLQFQLRPRGPGEESLPADTGPWVLDVHIPATGPLTPSAVAASLRRAVTFFDRHFPAQPGRLAVCGSWLLDPHLAQVLPASNIAAFQRRFTPFGAGRDDGLDALYFVFGVRSVGSLDHLPRDTALQRALLDRIVAGGRWQFVRGYCRLVDDDPTPVGRWQL